MLVRREDHESPLGRWRTYRWAPQPAEPVARFVELVWYFDGALTLLRERNFPNGCYDLIVQFDVPHRPIVGEPYADRFPSICFGGMNASPYIIEAPPGRIRVLGVVLRPLGAHAVLGLPLAGLAGYTSDLRSLLGIEANRLEARLHAAPQGPERVALTVRWLRARLARAREFDTAVAWAAERIDAGPAGSIASLRHQTGLDKTRFAARFRELVGVPPRRFATIVRVRKAIELLHGTRLPLSEIAMRCGYYDQPHMTNELRALAGLTPREYLTAQRFPESPGVAEPQPGTGEFDAVGM